MELNWRQTTILHSLATGRWHLTKENGQMYLRSLNGHGALVTADVFASLRDAGLIEIGLGSEYTISAAGRAAIATARGETTT